MPWQASNKTVMSIISKISNHMDLVMKWWNSSTILKNLNNSCSTGSVFKSFTEWFIGDYSKILNLVFRTAEVVVYLEEVETWSDSFLLAIS